jgi:hypothetical protein
MPDPRTLRRLLCLAALGTTLGAATVAVADDPDPVPVLPGRQVLAPGPRRLGLAGLAADPSTIGNFQGLVALAYLKGRVRDASGRRWVMLNDMRLVRGDYVAADGVARSGAFVFV